MGELPPDQLLYEQAEHRWEAVVNRDPRADGHFVYAVKTTGIYGRPSSIGRLPKRENVEFFSSAQAAEDAGYRPNRRRSGDRSSAASQSATVVAKACRFIEAADTPPDLSTLSTLMGMSAAHFHRMFKKETGVTPKAYGAAHRARRLREQLSGGEKTVTDAILEAGFNSNSRYYETSHARLGMSAKDYRRGGTGAVIRFAVGQSSFGAILVAQSEKGICAIFMGDDPDKLVHDLQDKFPKASLIGADATFEQTVAVVVGFVEQPSIGLNLPLDVQGTSFQERVWRALCEIPSGSTSTYTDIAQRIGAPTAVRAVASACGANRLAVAIPCHRIVRRDGDISGYRWGVERKKKLLEIERDDI